MRPFKVFLASTVVGVLIAAALLLPDSWRRQRAFEARPMGSPLSAGVSVRHQLSVGEIEGLKAAGFAWIVSLRPDGEAPLQPAAATMGAATAAAGLSFTYVPTPVSDIPDAVVQSLAATLASATGPVLIYCGSGWRAARVWALAEASRTGGADADTIMTAVRGAGHEIDDLAARIRARIAARST